MVSHLKKLNLSSLPRVEDRQRSGVRSVDKSIFFEKFRFNFLSSNRPILFDDGTENGPGRWTIYTLASPKTELDLVIALVGKRDQLEISFIVLIIRKVLKR